MPSTRTSSITPTLPAIDQRLYQALKADIALRGILVPLIFCAKSKQCLDGRVRLLIAEQLGIKQIPKIYVGNLTVSEGNDLRVVVNGLRRQLTRDQLSVIIEWSLRKDPSSSDRQHAQRTGADHKTVARTRVRMEGIGAIPQITTRTSKGGKTYPSTRKPMVFTHNQAGSNEAAKGLDRLGEKAPTGNMSLRKLRQLAMKEDREDELRKSGVSLPSHFDLRCCDFRNLDCPDNVADLCVLDPPWHTLKELRQPFAETVYRVLKPGAYALVYTGNQGLLDFGDVMRSAGLLFRWIIACTNDDENGALRNNGSIYNQWRPVSVYQKPGGKNKTPGVYKDLHRTVEREKTFFEWQQPIEESISFVKSFTRPGDLIVDLTFGSGTVPDAVARVGGGRRFLGCEIKKQFVDLAKRRIAAALEG